MNDGIITTLSGCVIGGFVTGFIVYYIAGTVRFMSRATKGRISWD